jgi:hypothetical protein
MTIAPGSSVRRQGRVGRSEHHAAVRGAFIVSCPRSGSTLLQAMLAQHPQVVSFPETHYFQKIRGRFGDRPPLGIVSPRAARRNLVAVAGTVGSDRALPRVVWPTVGGYARAFERVAQAAAVRDGRTLWVDKSPIHLHWMPQIHRHLPEASFVHIVRDGRDVVASLYELCLSDPSRWVPQVVPRGQAAQVRTVAGRARVLDAAIDRWNRDLARTIAHRGKPGHVIVSFEELVADPEAELTRLAAALGLDFDRLMLRPWESAPTVVGFRGHAPHMRKPFGPIRAERLARFHEVFDDAEQEHVRTRLAEPMTGI